MSHATWLVGVALAATVAAPGPDAAPKAAAPVSIPDTPAGRRARAVLESLTGDRGAREALVRGSFTARALEEMPAGEWSAFLDRIAAQSGGLDPVAISLDSSDDFLVMDARARKADRFARFYLAAATKTDPGKIADLGIFRIRDPAKV